MSKAQIIQALERAGLFVEAQGDRIHGLGDAGHVYARPCGTAWKLRRERGAKVGTIARRPEDVEAFGRPLARRPLHSAAEVYFDGAETFLLEPAGAL